MTEIWTLLGYTAEGASLFIIDPPPRTRAFARVGPDGHVSMDAPLVEVDPDALLRGLLDSIRTDHE